jgi:hypothetical protein
LVTISTPAIEPAISTLPVKNQLIANVSRVPSVRQLMAFRMDRVCVSAPRNKITRRASLFVGQSLSSGRSHPTAGLAQAWVDFLAGIENSLI